MGGRKFFIHHSSLFILLFVLAFNASASAQGVEDNEPTDFYLIDGVDFGEFGSYIPLEYLVRPVDWRGRDFNEYTTYWDYYGVTDLYADLDEVECNLNGVWQPLPAGLDVTIDKTHLTGFFYKENPADGTVDSRFGFLTYKNNGTVVNSDFKMRFYVSMDYKWGTIVSDEKIEVDVKATFNGSTDDTMEPGGTDNAGDATSLREEVKVNSEEFAAAAEWYTLDGRRLDGKPTQKGLYIYGGRKVVIK